MSPNSSVSSDSGTQYVGEEPRIFMLYCVLTPNRWNNRQHEDTVLWQITLRRYETGVHSRAAMPHGGGSGSLAKRLHF